MENEMKNEIARTTDTGLSILTVNQEVAPYCSFTATTREERVMLFNAVNSPEGRLKDFINTEIQVKHIYAEPVTFIDDDGVETAGTRVVFIDAEGRGYQTCSQGIFNAVRKLFATVGTPDTWEEPITIRIKQFTAKQNRNVLSFQLV